MSMRSNRKGSEIRGEIRGGAFTRSRETAIMKRKYGEKSVPHTQGSGNGHDELGGGPGRLLQRLDLNQLIRPAGREKRIWKEAHVRKLSKNVGG